MEVSIGYQKVPSCNLLQLSSEGVQCERTWLCGYPSQVDLRVRNWEFDRKIWVNESICIDIHIVYFAYFRYFQLGQLPLSSGTSNPSIVVRQTIGRTARNSWSTLAHHDTATPHNAHLYSSGPSIERHRRMECSNRIRRKDVCLVASNLHRHCRGARKQCREEDLVLNDNIRTRGWLPRSIPCSAVAGTRSGRGETVPEVELLFRDAWLAGLVGLDVVREEVAPVIVGHVVHVFLRALGNTLFSDWANIVGLSIVIPGKNLLCQFPSQFRQVKSCKGESGMLTSTNWGCTWSTCCQRLCHMSSPRHTQFLPYWGRLV